MSAAEADAANHLRDESMVDLSQPATYEVILGRTILHDGDEDQGPNYTAIKYNHKPSQDSAKRETHLSQSPTAPERYHLSILDNEGTRTSHYQYEGYRATGDPSGSYVLTYDPSQRAFTLDALESDLNFNLSSAPWEKDGTKLQQQYKQLEKSAESTAETNISTDGGEEEAEPAQPTDAEEAEDIERPETPEELCENEPDCSNPDDENPFDFRHYLHGNGPPLHRPESQSDASFKMTPNERDISDDPETPQARPLPREDLAKSRAKPKPKPKPKPKAKPKSKPRAKPKSKPTIAEMERAERRDDSADDESSLDNDLTIEMEPVTKPKPALGGSLGAALAAAAPRSLRSAASSLSPSSKRMTSSESDEDDDEDDGPGHGVRLPPSSLRHEQEPEPERQDHEALRLPSPALHQGVEDDPEDELEAELAQVLGSEDFRMERAESESESEEE
ncbi:MAG: hypothetical protein M1838_003422 [Thelocarpon superellum]|nr:MAG: hypothetical protein M1838_003422 [Thelocarpon superellum]